jgi:hypothetical protein
LTYFLYGALNRAFQLNLDSNGLFLPKQQLREQFNRLIGAIASEQGFTIAVLVRHRLP